MKRKKSLIIAGIVFISSCLILSAAQSKKTIAVLDFQVNSNNLKLGKNFSEYTTIEKDTSLFTADLINALVNDRTFDVVERSQFYAIEKERKLKDLSVLELSGRGKTLGADYLVMGNIELVEAQKRSRKFPSSGIEFNEFTGRYVVNLRVVDAKTSKIAFANKVTYVDTVRLNEYSEMSPLLFMNQLKEGAVRELINTISETISPIQVASVAGGYVYLNRGEASELKRGMELEIFLPNKIVHDPENGEIIGSTEYKIAQVKVTEVLPKMTKAQVISYSMPIEPGAICRTVKSSRGDAGNIRPISEPSSEEPVSWN